MNRVKRQRIARVLIGNKVDLACERAVETSRAQALADEYGLRSLNAQQRQARMYLNLKLSMNLDGKQAILRCVRRLELCIAVTARMQTRHSISNIAVRRKRLSKYSLDGK
jgi:hypothetical protein